MPKQERVVLKQRDKNNNNPYLRKTCAKTGTKNQSDFHELHRLITHKKFDNYSLFIFISHSSMVMIDILIDYLAEYYIDFEMWIFDLHLRQER